MDKIITIREYKEWLVNCNTKHIIEEDIATFKRQILRIEDLIKFAEDFIK